MRDLGFRAAGVVVIGGQRALTGAAAVTGYPWPPRAGPPRPARRTISAMPLIARALLTERGGVVGLLDEETAAPGAAQCVIH
jgi:hypothetical protein